MLAAFIIPFPVARIDNVLQTVRFLEINHPEIVKISEIILMCQDRCGKIDTKFPHYQLHNMKCPYMEKCKLVNKGVECVSPHTENLVFLDSDRVLPPGYFNDVLNNLKEGTAVTTKRLLRLTKPFSDQDILDGKYTYEEENRSIDNKALMRNLFAGNCTMKKKDFLKAGGMDEDYVGYGFEDHDMTNRIVQAGIEPVWRDEVELHLFHERLTYGSGDQRKMFLDNGLRYCRKWNLPIPGKLQHEINEYTKRMI